MGEQPELLAGLARENCMTLEVKTPLLGVASVDADGSTARLPEIEEALA